jgi:lipopolysaccharide heptosyltransferase I
MAVMDDFMLAKENQTSKNDIRAFRSPRILIVRLTAIGDVVHGIPVLCALREALPNAFIGWITEGTAGDVLEGHPALDELIRVPRRYWKSLREIRQMRERLRELKFDITLDLQCLSKSAITAWLSGAKRRIGKSGEHGRELSRVFNNELVEAGGTHVIEHYLSMLRALGIESPEVRFDLPERAADAQLIDSFLRESSLVGQQFAILNPGAGWPSKMWPAQRYGELAQHLFRAHGVRSVAAWGTPAEVPMAEAIVAASDGHAVMAPPTSMLQLGALCRRAALFVGSDTGPMHLAAAVGTPTVSMHGPSRADWCGAYGGNNLRMQIRYEAGSSLERRRADDSAMRAITVAMAAHACDQLLTRNIARKCG